MQAADDALKARKLSKTWALLFAADDANLFLPIVDLARNSLKQYKDKLDVHTVRDSVLNAYRKLFDTEFTSRHLARYNIPNITTFRDSGLGVFGKDRFDRMCDALDDFDLGITLVCYGFDTKRMAHIFDVSNPGKITDHNLLGYAVTGSGSYMATASLRRKPLPYDLDPMTYRLLEAKFSAESAPGVGRNTSVFILRSDGRDTSIGYGAMEKIRDVWTRSLLTEEPRAAVDIISQITAATKADR